MPLNIIRNDITRVSADAIVNTANPMVAVGAGVDQSIYEAAGFEQLLAERAKIGPMEPGQAAVTPAFGLDAKYIIHTVGPAWRGGDYRERETVASCYRRSLQLAAELDCASIAFPLISTGTYGFPKDEALRIAVSEISSFLLDHEMMVYMVVYSREAFVVSGRIFSDIKSYIEDRDVRERPRDVRRTAFADRSVAECSLYNAPKLPKASGPSSKKGGGRKLFGRLKEERERKRKEELEIGAEEPKPGDLESPTIVEDAGHMPVGAAPDSAMIDAEFDSAADADFESAVTDVYLAPTASFDWDLEQYLEQHGESFQQMLFRHIDRRGLTDPQVYKKANIDRKLFSKIRSNENYMPSKKTVLALAIALELNMDETLDLLRRAGLALSPASDFDLIVGYCINHKVYNIFEINTYLFEYDQPLLGA